VTEPDRFKRAHPGANTDKRDIEYSRHCFERDHVGRHWDAIPADAQMRHITVYRRDFL